VAKVIATAYDSTLVFAKRYSNYKLTILKEIISPREGRNNWLALGVEGHCLSHTIFPK
jgi:hypothetical protein